MIHEQLTAKAIGAAYEVYNTLGPGFEEAVYERAMLIELHLSGLRAEPQVPITVSYKGHIVGDYRADILVEGILILELKAVRALLAVHEAQLVNYLVATGKDVGLLINFGESRVDIKRKTRTIELDKKNN